MAVVEYAHLVVKLDLKEAMAQVKEACENIQRTADHCRQHAHGMDIHELMLRQDDLCEAYITRLQNQIYALGSEVRVKGMTDPFKSNRDKRQYQKFRGADESYAELVKRVKKEGKDGFVKKMGLPLSMKDDVGDRFCGFHDLVSDERSDHLFARCQAWWLPEMSSKMSDLRFTPEAVKIFDLGKNPGVPVDFRPNKYRPKFPTDFKKVSSRWKNVLFTWSGTSSFMLTYTI